MKLPSSTLNLTKKMCCHNTNIVWSEVQINGVYLIDKFGGSKQNSARLCKNRRESPNPGIKNCED